MSTAPKYLVVGSDGVIGKALLSHLNQHTQQALGTTHREPVGIHQIYLELADKLDVSVIPPAIQVVINCAAVARLEACLNDPIGSRRVNVDSVIALAEQCRQLNRFFVHLSSDKVFSGQTANMPADAPFAPITEYGRQKAEAERYLLTLLEGGIPLAIIRLTKVLTHDMQLLRNWREALQRGETIKPFADMTLAPVILPTVLAAIDRIIESQEPGVFQISGDLDVTYAEVAVRLARRLGANASLVQPVQGQQTGRFKEVVSKNTSLDTDNTKQRLNLTIPSTWEAMEWAFDTP